MQKMIWWWQLLALGSRKFYPTNHNYNLRTWFYSSVDIPSKYPHKIENPPKILGFYTPLLLFYWWSLVRWFSVDLCVLNLNGMVYSWVKPAIFRRVYLRLVIHVPIYYIYTCMCICMHTYMYIYTYIYICTYSRHTVIYRIICILYEYVPIYI